MEARMKKRMVIMLIALGILFGLIIIYKVFIGIMMGRAMSAQANRVVTISATKVVTSMWDPTITAVGSMRALRGVNVTTELAGMVTNIYFEPGAFVKKDTVLVQLNAATEIGQLEALQASLALAKITYERDKAQFAIHAVSKQTLDTDFQNVRNFTGQVNEAAGTLAKKTIRAPFTGRLGISLVNPGQYLNAGDTVSTLQTLDPIYADFYLPQRALARLRLNYPVVVTTEIFQNKSFKGKISTINPIVDTNTRNVLVEATIENPDYLLIPGMFTNVVITTGAPKSFITVPQTAITFNSFGNIVYVINEQKDQKTNQSKLIANQVFVTTGETRGDQIQVLTGLKEGQTVVTSGQIKLKNGDVVAIDNTVTPSDSPAPNVSENY